MKRYSLLAITAILGAAVVNILTGARAAEFKLPDTDATPAELVNAALRSELDGPSDVRKTLLDRALKLDPNYAPARWHSGYVRYEGEWVTLSEAAKRAEGDKQLAEYRKRRDALVDRADDHRELARWCKKNGLAEEARVHWAKVLEFNPADADALSALGLQLYEGQLLTKQQIVEAKKRAGERMQAMRHWQPQMVKWRKAIETGHGQEEAREAMREFDDADAIGTLEAVFASDTNGGKADELNRIFIETVGRMPTPEATQVLLRYALQSNSGVAIVAACDQLKKRPMYAYVPQLIAAAPGKIRTRFNIFVLPNGMVLHEHEVLLEGREAELSMTYTSSLIPGDTAMAMAVTPRAVANEASNAEQIEARFASARAQQESVRRRVQLVLSRTTGFESAEDPELWRKQYNEYYHWANTAPAPKRRFHRNLEVAQALVQTPTATSVSETDIYTDPTRPCECFPAGTMVATLAGMRPIEELSTGDRVLSQDPLSGELSYRPVQERTLRLVPELLSIRTGDSRSVVATLGHPIWVVGKGWRVANHLSPGDRLHSLTGHVVVDSTERIAGREVYNLIVSGSHNYFVGEMGLYVHDNSPIAEAGTALPGLRLADTTP